MRGNNAKLCAGIKGCREGGVVWGTLMAGAGLAGLVGVNTIIISFLIVWLPTAIVIGVGICVIADRIINNIANRSSEYRWFVIADPWHL